MKAGLQKFLESLLDPNGAVSFGRVMSLLITTAVLAWDTANLVFAWQINHHLPAGMNPFPLLPDATTLVAEGGFCTLFYGVTKYGETKGGTKEEPGV